MALKILVRKVSEIQPPTAGVLSYLDSVHIYWFSKQQIFLTILATWNHFEYIKKNQPLIYNQFWCTISSKGGYVRIRSLHVRERSWTFAQYKSFVRAWYIVLPRTNDLSCANVPQRAQSPRTRIKLISFSSNKSEVKKSIDIRNTGMQFWIMKNTTPYP